MRQVPYGVIGNGRLATHLRYYLSSLCIPVIQWHRHCDTPVAHAMDSVQHIIIAIPDDAIDPFIDQRPDLKAKCLIHCSGCLSSKNSHMAHPLMTFGPTIYHKNQYLKIPFILEKSGPAFSELLPGLPNPHYRIAQQDQALYHALCVLANNGITLLLQHVLKEIEATLSLPHSVIKPILEHTIHNVLTDPRHALTGPWVRHDTNSIAQNLHALKNTPLEPLYQQLLHLYRSHRDEQTSNCLKKASAAKNHHGYLL